VNLAVLVPAGAHVRGEQPAGERHEVQPAEGPPLPFSWDLLKDPDGTAAWVTALPRAYQLSAPTAHATAIEWTPSRGAVLYRCPICRNSALVRRMEVVPKLHAGLRGSGGCRVYSHSNRLWLQLPTEEQGRAQAEAHAAADAERAAEERRGRERWAEEVNARQRQEQEIAAARERDFRDFILGRARGLVDQGIGQLLAEVELRKGPTARVEYRRLIAVELEAFFHAFTPAGEAKKARAEQEAAERAAQAQVEAERQAKLARQERILAAQRNRRSA